MQLFLIRHGETALNVARVLQPADTPLSARGIVQADALARRLGAMQVDAIVSSDLPRALRTAEAIRATTGAPIETTPLLQERNFGAWRGQRYEDLGVDPLNFVEAPPQGESAAAFEKRVAAAFEHVVERQAAVGGAVAVVTHGLVLRVMLRTHVVLAAGTPQPAHLGNTCLSLVDARAPYNVTLLNCVQHLDAAATRDDENALSGG